MKRIEAIVSQQIDKRTGDIALLIKQANQATRSLDAIRKRIERLRKSSLTPPTRPNRRRNN